MLEQYGYAIVRQTGSHVKLVKNLEEKRHFITIPNHSPIKIGTLHGIVKDVCSVNKFDAFDIYDRL